MFWVVGAVEGASAHVEELDQIAGDVVARDVDPQCEVREREAVGGRHNAGLAITGVDDHAGGKTYAPERVGVRCGDTFDGCGRGRGEQGTYPARTA